VHQYVRNAYYPVKLVDPVQVEEHSFAH